VERGVKKQARHSDAVPPLCNLLIVCSVATGLNCRAWLW
jgi:hypothetical protein